MYDVIYGAGSSFIGKAYPKTAGNLSCSNTTFGVDPALGVPKSCAYAVIN